MKRGHSHYAELMKLLRIVGEPPPCPYRTRKDCNDAMKAWRAEGKAYRAKLSAEEATAAAARREQAFTDFVELEKLRVAELLRYYKPIDREEAPNGPDDRKHSTK